MNIKKAHYIRQRTLKFSYEYSVVLYPV